jgi:hypothetical protein
MRLKILIIKIYFFGFKIPLSIIFPNFKGENSIKGSTYVSGNFLKLHFCIFEKSKGEHNSLVVNIYFGIPLLTKFQCSKINANQKSLCMFKTLKLLKWIIFFSLKHLFSLTNVQHSF